jgi:SAM-dependent methyltransferase
VSHTVLQSAWESAARLVAETRDVLDARPVDDVPSPALVARGWAPFLSSLDDAELNALEGGGHEVAWPSRTPSSLLDLARRIHRACALPSLLPSVCPPREEPRADARRERPRKRAQIEAFARLVAPLAAHATRVVDVGSGHGHLTRELAAQLALPVVGLERDATLAERARALSRSRAREASPSFAVTDVLLDGLPLLAGDCAIGLHACGELGDAMAERAASLGASLVLVACCLQKRRALTRRPLCVFPAPGAGVAPSSTAEEWPASTSLELPRALLGLSNLTARDRGVEATRSENLAGRERRLALHALLSAIEPGLRPGAEIAGLNRRAAQGELPKLVARAFALRGRPPPSVEAIAAAAAHAHVSHAAVRRLALPRAMLARLLEVFVLLDRARYLEERGFDVAVGILFGEDISARNLALVASRR